MSSILEQLNPPSFTNILDQLNANLELPANQGALFNLHMNVPTLYLPFHIHDPLRLGPITSKPPGRKEYKRIQFPLHPDKNPHYSTEEQYKLVNHKWQQFQDLSPPKLDIAWTAALAHAFTHQSQAIDHIRDDIRTQLLDVKASDATPSELMQLLQLQPTKDLLPKWCAHVKRWMHAGTNPRDFATFAALEMESLTHN